MLKAAGGKRLTLAVSCHHAGHKAKLAIKLKIELATTFSCVGADKATLVVGLPCVIAWIAKARRQQSQGSDGHQCRQMLRPAPPEIHRLKARRGANAVNYGGPSWSEGQPGEAAEPLATGTVSTYYVLVNVTLALDERLVARAREVAAREGLSLNEMIRRHLEVVAGVQQGPLVADEMRRLWASFPGHSGGQRFNRADAYEGRL